jgi:hypothetical protein
MTKWDNANRLAFSDNLDDRFEREHRKRNYALMACEANDAIHTVGHSIRTIEVFIDLLRNHTIELLIDVRRWPASRRHPHFHRDRLAVSLGDSGVYYLWRGDLGGFRKPSEISPNTAWRVGAFRAYADFMLTPEFQTIMSEVDAPRSCVRRRFPGGVTGSCLPTPSWSVAGKCGTSSTTRATSTSSLISRLWTGCKSSTDFRFLHSEGIQNSVLRTQIPLFPLLKKGDERGISTSPEF